MNDEQPINASMLAAHAKHQRLVLRREYAQPRPAAVDIVDRGASAGGVLEAQVEHPQQVRRNSLHLVAGELAPRAVRGASTEGHVHLAEGNGLPILSDAAGRTQEAVVHELVRVVEYLRVEVGSRGEYGQVVALSELVASSGRKGDRAVLHDGPNHNGPALEPHDLVEAAV